MITHLPLTNEFAKVTNASLENNMSVLTIEHLHCLATVSLYGGQVLSYRPVLSNTQLNDKADSNSTIKGRNQQDIFWVSDEAIYQHGKAIRGGIPLCWPWFGANDQATDKLPSTNHGFARELNWQVASTEATEDNVTIVLVLLGENQHPLWPTSFRLKQTLVFGKTFKQSLEMTNLSSENAQYSGALHSYFRVSNPKNISIEALTGCDYDDKLTASCGYQESAVSCVGPIDREYHINAKKEQIQKVKYHQDNVAVIIDEDWQRQVEITSMGCSQWVLWNPGTELANTMPDIHNNGEQEFVCLEAANSKWQLLPAGKTITIGQEIKVSLLYSST